MNTQLRIKLCRQCRTPYRDEFSQCPNCGSKDAVVVAPIEQIDGDNRHQQLYGTVEDIFEGVDVNYRPIYKVETQRRKSFLPIVTSVVAILVIAVGIVMYAQHTIYEHSNLEAYKAGLSYYDDGDYENTLQSLRSISTDSRYFTEARNLMKVSVVCRGV